MQLDKHGTPIYDDKDIFDLIYAGHFNKLDQLYVKDSKELRSLESISELNLKYYSPELESIEVFDAKMQHNWFMPDDYCPNLIELLYDMCTTEEQRSRVDEELEAFIHHGMMDLLFFLKYLVDTLEKNNILWGVGRGSSVASYVLFLIGVHQIDSLKYNLDWRDFLR